jgi:hypothetical protein
VNMRAVAWTSSRETSDSVSYDSWRYDQPVLFVDATRNAAMLASVIGIGLDAPTADQTLEPSATSPGRTWVVVEMRRIV